MADGVRFTHGSVEFPNIQSETLPHWELDFSDGGEGGKAYPTVAVISFHGMGTQLPMQSLNGAAFQMLRVLRDRGFGVEDETPISTMNANGHTLTKVEINYKDAKKSGKAMIFEAYYSPFLKGKSQPLEIILFFLRSGFRAIFQSAPKRRIYQQMYTYNSGLGKISILFLMLVLISLLIVNVAAIEIFIQAIIGVSVENVYGITFAVGVLTCMSLLLAMVAIMFGLRKLLNRGGMDGVDNGFTRLVAAISYWGFIVSLTALSVTALLTLCTRINKILIPEEELAWLSDWIERLPLVGVWASITHGPGLIWVAILSVGLSLIVRSVLRNFLGDVVTYVFGYQSSKFYNEREAVRERAVEVIRAVCTNPEINRVVIYAHSLGTVVAYDAINRYLLSESKSAHKLRSFVTYGSPLDKIAFVYRSESGLGGDLNSALISSRQPMVDSALVRSQIRWWNVHARYDVVAGPLEYYDPVGHHRKTDGNSRYVLKGSNPHRIQNRVDKTNLTPLFSHIDYEKNPALTKSTGEAVDYAVGWP